MTGGQDWAAECIDTGGGEMSKIPTEPCCQACGVPWIEHVGVRVLCETLDAAKAESERLRNYLRYIRHILKSTSPLDLGPRLTCVRLIEEVIAQDRSGTMSGGQDGLDFRELEIVRAANETCDSQQSNVRA